jgi:hypothetical protein
VDAANVIAIVIGLCGLSGCVFTALRFRRDDTTSIVTQQSTVLHDMEAIAAQLRIQLEDCEQRGRPT